MNDSFPLDIPSTETPISATAFSSLKAEDEPWLLNGYFVPPPNIEQVTGERSVIVFGAPGSGKTALSHYLKRLCLNTDDSPNRLLVEWTPSPAVDDDKLSDIAAVQMQAKQVLDACAEAILRLLAFYPTCLQAAPPTSTEALSWFLKKYSQIDLSLRVEQLIEKKQPPGESILKSIISATPRNVLPDNASPDKVAARLVTTLKSIGLAGVWVIGNDAELEMWAEVAPDDLVVNLSSFFSTLPLFERANFSYKLLLPAWLEQKMMTVVHTIRQRQRLSPYYLRQWDTACLEEVVMRRLQLAMERPFTLRQLCTAPDLIEWLDWVGTPSPREWLEQVKPLVDYYRDHNLKTPVDQKTWYKLRRNHPPKIYLDDEGKRITVGARQISLDKLPTKAYEILKYLYRQPDNYVASRAELYYRFYRELDYVPIPTDKHYELPGNYRGALDTALWRIREAIEPNPSRRNHVLIITVRGHGIKLNTRW